MQTRHFSNFLRPPLTLIIAKEYRNKFGKDAQADWGEVIGPPTAMYRQTRVVSNF